LRRYNLEIISRCLRPGGVWVNFGRAAQTLLATSQVAIKLKLKKPVFTMRVDE
jgi:hypothetical protein